MADPAAATKRPVVGTGGVGLAVTERGRGNGPTVVAIHGYPDNQSVWGLVADDLAVDHHVVTYDVRGAGGSDAPANRRPGHGRWGRLASQAVHSWYVVAFHTPLAPVAWRGGLGRLWPKVLERRENVPVDDHWPGPQLADDAARGVQLYRANMFQVTARAARHPRQVRTEVPVQLLVPVGDRFVRPALLDGIEEIAPDLVRRDVGGRHWLPRSRPDLVARWTREHIAAVDADRCSGSSPSTGRASSPSHSGDTGSALAHVAPSPATVGPAAPGRPRH